MFRFIQVSILFCGLLGQFLVHAQTDKADKKEEIIKGCSYSIFRTACPGKEEEMLLPYQGVNPTAPEAVSKATDEEACLKAATKASKIIRGGVISKKEVTVKFDGKPIGTKSDTKECQ